MILDIISSGSKGNSYVLHNKKEALVIECGMPIINVKKIVNFDVSKIVCALCSHSHKDHSGYVNDFLNARIQVCYSAQTHSEVKPKSDYNPFIIEAENRYSFGGFTVLPFACKHDVECFGFLIQHPEIGLMLFATDTYYLPYAFANLTNIMIECNYRKDLLDANIKAGRIPAALRDRTLQSHMEFDTCKTALLANDLSKVNNIILIHLSDGNSHAEEFRRDIHAATGKTVHVADKNMTIGINKTPF